MKTLSSVKCFEGQQLQLQHESAALSCTMQFSVYLPPAAVAGKKVPVVYWLSGLTCNDQNFTTKAGAQRIAADLGIALVMPDTSPRGPQVPVDPDNSWDFGLGAGFYVNATQAPWKTHYQMERYVVDELPELVEAEFPVQPRRAICGHSMGGHGALTIALNHPNRYASVSAFSPIVAPSQCPWGRKALGHYLGESRESWLRYDTVALVRAGARQLPMLVDQGTADSFLAEQLKTDLLITACAEMGYKAQINYRDGYDHSYYFIASFIENHLKFHARHL